MSVQVFRSLEVGVINRVVYVLKRARVQPPPVTYFLKCGCN
jgi:hypothetical protein